MLVYVLNKKGKTLMPTTPRKARRLMKQGKAKAIKRKPFTIQLIYGSSGYKQDITLGIDSGYENIGFSAVSEKKELVSGECKMLKGISERLKEKKMYRRQRRSRKRYRKPRFDNRRKEVGWLAPSIQHKLDTHKRLIDKIKSILPITKTIVEVANFDIQKIKNPNISGEDYQEGEQKGYWNLREYILHRDNHKCQNPNCNNKSKHKILEVHHIGFWKKDRSNRSSNLITLCDKCHTPKNHKEMGFLYGWKPKLKSFKPETFMSTVRWRLTEYDNITHTFGYMTKSKRIGLGLEKTHYNDAFCIAGGNTQKRTEPLIIEQIKRNNRSLEKFYDAKYIDSRTKEKVSGQELNCGRRTRNKNLNGENLRKYREKKVSKGRRSIRRKRYFYQPKDLVIYNNAIFTVKGIQNLGTYIKLDGLSKPVKTDLVEPYEFKKGLCIC